MDKTKLATGCAIAALCFTATPMIAQAISPDLAQPKAAQSSAASSSVEEVIVTGSAHAERRFDVSYAVNSLSQDDISKIAPGNFADLVGTVPGIQVEATGGEAQNITRVRGIPTDRGYLIFQQDGLPLFQEIDGNFFNSGEGMNRLDLMTERVEFVRGGPSPIYASDAAAIANNITVTGTDISRGKAQVTLGDTGLVRLDAVQSGSLGSGDYYAVGGFLRQHEGYRDNGFPNDRGGQIRANLKHTLSNGFLKVSATYLNDHNVFYLPLPVADPRNPSVSLNQYINIFTGTMNTPSLRNVNIKYISGDGAMNTIHRDLGNGRHMQFGNIGLDYEAAFGDWNVAVKTGFTSGKLNFDALYSTTNPADGTAYAASFLTSAQTAFGATTPVARVGYAIANTNGAVAYDPAVASGLVMQAQYRAVDSSFFSGQMDASVVRTFHTGFGDHQIKAGFYTADWSETNFAAYQDYLLEVKSKPRTLDMVAYSASGAVLGYVTNHGVLHNTTTLNQGKTDGKMAAIYFNDTWDIINGLRLDAGVRHEWYKYNGYGLTSKAANMGDATTLADDSVRAFDGGMVSNSIEPTVTNYTVGLNYDFTENFGTYGRVSHLEVPPQSTAMYSTSPVILTTKLEQYEAGFKAAFGRSYVYVTGFYTKFNPLNASYLAFNSASGRNDVSVPIIGTAATEGIEADGAFNPVSWFSLVGSVTISDPHYTSMVNKNTGLSVGDVNGKQIVREPKIYGNIRPTFNFDIDETQVEIYGKYEYTSKRFIDYLNQTAMDAYNTVGAGVTVTRGSWQVQLVGDNLFNDKGLTEGNTRTDVLAGQGSATPVYGRPIFGRNARLVLSTSW